MGRTLETRFSASVKHHTCRLQRLPSSSRDSASTVSRGNSQTLESASYTSLPAYTASPTKLPCDSFLEAQFSQIISYGELWR